MKKRILLIIMTVILALGVTFTACAKTDNDLSDVDYVRQSYAVAVEKGFDGTLEEWIELLKGEKGADGKSAYQLAVENAGFSGTFEQWLASLKGEKGENGADGKDGADGINGQDGRGIADVKIENGALYVKYTDSDKYVYVGVVKGEDGKDGTNGKDGFDGTDGKDGADGKDGVNILELYIKDGELHAYFSNGKKMRVGKVVGDKGDKGDKGDAGRGVAEFKIENGVLYVRYTDGDTFYPIGGVKGDKGDKGDKGEDGKDGINGTDGKDGQDGRSVENVVIKEGNLFIKYSDAEDYVLIGKVKGDKGADGQDGQDLNINEVYQAAKNSGYTGTLLEFLKDYLKVETTEASERIVTKSLLSTVAIATKYGAEGAVSSGSGVIYKGDKRTGEVYIITNFHMVYNASYTPSISSEIYVFFYGMPFVKLSKDNPSLKNDDASKYMLLENYGIKATYVAGSMSGDIAVLKINNCEKYKTGPYRPAELIDDSDELREGEKSYVVGNAEGKGLSAASGIISLQSSDLTLTVDTKTNEEFTFRVIRTDAAVNHGNSGGGLYNKDGKLMGIVNAKTQSVTVDNFGYALPINAVMGLVNNLLARAADSQTNDDVYFNGYGYYKCQLGISVTDADGYADYDEKTGTVTSRAHVTVTGVMEDGASHGILKEGDVLVSIEINGVKRNMFRKYQPGDILLYARKGDIAGITVNRNGEILTLEVPLNNVVYMK